MAKFCNVFKRSTTIFVIKSICIIQNKAIQKLNNTWIVLMTLTLQRTIWCHFKFNFQLCKEKENVSIKAVSARRRRYIKNTEGHLRGWKTYKVQVTRDGLKFDRSKFLISRSKMPVPLPFSVDITLCNLKRIRKMIVHWT